MASFIFHIMYILVNTLIFVCLIGNKQGKEVKNMHRDWNLIKQVILIIEKSDKNKPLRKQEFESIGASKDALDYTFQLLLDGGYVFPDESLPDLRTSGVGQLTCKGQDLYDKLTAPDKAKEATDEAIDKWLKSDF